MIALALRDVSVVIAGRRLVDGVTLSIERGAWLGIIGANGAGKTTLLRAIAGLVSFTGTIAVDDATEPVRSRRHRARHLAYAPQEPHLPADMPVRAFVALGRTPHVGAFGRTSADDDTAIDAAVHRLSLQHLVDRPLVTLSGGERRRVVLAQALAQTTPIVLLDEPTAALDIGHQQQVMDLLDEIRHERDLTVVTTLHDLTLAGQYPTRLALLARGRVVECASPSAVLTPEHLAAHYGARVEVSCVDGHPVITPTRGSPS